jgi:hypothetical protein
MGFCREEGAPKGLRVSRASAVFLGGKLARGPTIPGDTDRLEVCATPNADGVRTPACAFSKGGAEKPRSLLSQLRPDVLEELFVGPLAQQANLVRVLEHGV